MELLLIQSLLENGVLDFDRLVLQEYKNVGLSELEAMTLIRLRKLRLQGFVRLQPDKLAELFSITPDQVYQTLDKLLHGDFLTIQITKNEEGKEMESFHVDRSVHKMISGIEKRIEFAQTKLSKIYDTPEEAIVDYLETSFQRQLTPIDIEIIKKWLIEDHYDLVLIKQAIIDTVKANKTSISFVDTLLMKKSKKKAKPSDATYSEQKPIALQSFFDSWKKE
ncbi:MAG: DnaD domain protein [bacterium]|nr:DnaD domain protein [bacterium]